MAQKKASSKSEATAAVAEVNPTERTTEWQGLTLTLPASLPEAVFMDLALVRAGDDPTATFQMLLSMVGERQFNQVRAKIRAGDAGLKEAAELVGQIFEEYGTSEGESEASQDS